MKRYVKLQAPRKDGSRLYDHLTKVVEQGKPWPEEFPLPEIPEQLQYAWDWYWEIRSGVSMGMAGYDPISHMEMVAWSQLTRININPTTLKYLRLLDVTFLDGINRTPK